jgi:phosphohistidine phosphatase SixA
VTDEAAVGVTTILLVRHADAGTKRAWAGDDRARPLSARGIAEAAALVDILLPQGVTRIISSPLLRCEHTVEPLARAIGLRTEFDERLAPERADDATPLLLALATSDDAVVVCTHGEVIEQVQARLPQRGAFNFGPAPQRRAKGSTWVLRSQRGLLIDAEYIAPPMVERDGA